MNSLSLLDNAFSKGKNAKIKKELLNVKQKKQQPQTERLHYLFAMETSPPTRTRARAADMIALCAILTSTRAATARTVHSFLAFCK